MPTMDGFFKLKGGGEGQIPDKFTTTESPKYKFLFFVKFTFRTASPIHSGTDELTTNAFAVKQAGRPTPVITYQDANYYGYRTKVATKVDFTTINLSFFDDSSNRSHSVFDSYINAVSPIVSINDANNLFDSQTIGALPDGAELGPIKHIEVIHGYKGPSRTTYKFLNPKITNVMLDELDMMGSEVSGVTLTFNYDAFNIEHN